jgi:hypothetical protein
MEKDAGRLFLFKAVIYIAGTAITLRQGIYAITVLLVYLLVLKALSAKKTAG